MSGRLQRVLQRGVSVALLTGTLQAVVFVAGWAVVYRETHVRVAESVADVILQANAATAESILEGLGSIPDVSVPGSDEWERVQGLVEGLELGGDGFACVVGPDGTIACHPELRSSPGLSQVRMADHTLVEAGSGRQRPLSELAPGRVEIGTVELGPDGLHYMAAVRDAESGSLLLVHQPAGSLAAAAGEATSSMMTSMLMVGSIVVVLTMLLAFGFIRAHDRTLARWNSELEATVEARTTELVRTHRAIIFGMAKLAEYRDSDTGLHVERMCAYTGVIAREYQRRFGNLPAQWIEDVELAASMHDIGKVAIPDRVLLKQGRFDAQELELMKSHATAGARALAAVRERIDDAHLVDLGIEIAGGHHERWDGAGYPRGLSGEAIPLSARIVAVADVFDALMSKRVYKEAIPFAETLSLIREGCGSQFDPRVVESFEAVADELRTIHARLQDLPGPVSPLPHCERRATEAVGSAA